MSGPVPPPLRRDGLAWAVSIYFAVQSMAFYIGLSWLPSILADAGYSDEGAGFLQALSALVQLPPAFLVPVLASRRRSQEGILAAIVATSAVPMLGLLLAEDAAVLWMVLLGLGQGGALGLALILPVLRGGEPGTVATLTAMTLSVGYLGAALGPWVAGVLHDATGGWRATLVFLLAVTVLQFVPGLPASRDRRLAGAGGASVTPPAVRPRRAQVVSKATSPAIPACSRRGPRMSSAVAAAAASARTAPTHRASCRPST